MSPSLDLRPAVTKEGRSGCKQRCGGDLARQLSQGVLTEVERAQVKSQRWQHGGGRGLANTDRVGTASTSGAV